jgi:hypothetical protein
MSVHDEIVEGHLSEQVNIELLQVKSCSLILKNWTQSLAKTQIFSNLSRHTALA